MAQNMAELPTFDEEKKFVNIVIEAEKGSRIKLKYDKQSKLFRVHKVLPLGTMFPFDYGFLPCTEGGDGDPLDVFAIGDTGLPTGTVVLGSPVGVLLCEQTEKGKTKRNDRVIALPVNAVDHGLMQPVMNADEKLMKLIGEFLASYNELQGKKLRVIGVEGPKRGMAVVRKGMETAQRNGRAAA